MPFPMKIQPIDSHSLEEVPPGVKPATVVKSRLKRIFDLQFLKNPAAAATVEKVAADEPHNSTIYSKDNSAGSGGEFEPSSICLAKMVQNFIEENQNEKQQTAARCGRNRCNCFNGNDSSEDEFDSQFGFSGSNLSSSEDAIEKLKSFVPYASVSEKNLLADIEKIVEKNKIVKQKDENCRKIVVDGLVSLGYDASTCKSRWENSSSYPAGEYEYVDVIMDGERLIVDIDFRSEFEIARSTKMYKSILQFLPLIYVGKSDRLANIILIVSDAAKQSLKKKGMPIPPWRKAEYVKAKWLSPHTRANPPHQSSSPISNLEPEKIQPSSEKVIKLDNEVEDIDLGETIFDLSGSYEEEKSVSVSIEWKPPAPEIMLKPKSLSIGIKAVGGLASIMEADP
ncbi:uncharacterized protein [Rutidosis leptorrhynchoides]|uniref:uncharacterized protein n=1 Tax=Rutidosis leptorrhynchoides TaxID=125765 RepID=UPI003A995DE4